MGEWDGRSGQSPRNKINDLRRQLEVVEARLDELIATTNDKAIEEGRRLLLRKRMNELADAAEALKKEIEKLKDL